MKVLLPSLLIACIALLVSSTTLKAGEPFPDDLKIGGFAIGCQAWTFNRFSVFEANLRSGELRRNG